MLRVGTLAASAMLIAMSCGGCATSRADFVVALPNGYQIVRGGKADEPMIVKRSGGVVVPGPVERYTVLRNVVVGKVSEQEYFVLDTSTGELGKGLSESAYNERLKSLNISGSPELSPPVLPK